MSYWISVVDANSKGAHPHYELGEMSMSCSWNYIHMMSHLPCGWVREWQGKLAEDMINPVYGSIVELNANREKYVQYELENNLGTIETCREILEDALKLFREYPEGIIRVD